MLFIINSAYKSIHGQDSRIYLIHMLTANKSEYFDIHVYFPMSAMDRFWGITLRSMHYYAEDKVWHKKKTQQYSEYHWSVIFPKISKAIHIGYGKVYIKTFRNAST